MQALARALNAALPALRVAWSRRFLATAKAFRAAADGCDRRCLAAAAFAVISPFAFYPFSKLVWLVLDQFIQPTMDGTAPRQSPK